MKPNAAERAALILSLLGQPEIDEVLTRMKPEQAERLRSVKERGASRRLRGDVLSDFERYLRFVLEQTPPKPRLHDEDHPDGNGAVPATSRSGKSERSLDSDADPARALEQVTESQIAAALESEPPRAAAMLLAALPPRRSADILAHMAVEQRERVVPELGRDQPATPAIVDRVMRAVWQRAVTIPAKGIARVDRIGRLADVLRAVARPLAMEMLKTLTDSDPDTAEAVKEKLYLFDDLATAGDRLVQKVLAEVDGTTLAAALFGADDAIREKVFSNLSRRARAALQEEMEFQTDLPPARVDAARTDVARALARVDQESP